MASTSCASVMGPFASSCAAMRALVSSVVFAAEADDEVRDGLAQGCVLFGIAGLERFELGDAGLLEVAGLGRRSDRPWRGRRGACTPRSLRRWSAARSSRRSRRRRRRRRPARRSCVRTISMLRSVAVFESAGLAALKRPRYFCEVSGSRLRKAVPVSCSALTSSVSCTIFSAL